MLSMQFVQDTNWASDKNVAIGELQRFEQILRAHLHQRPDKTINVFAKKINKKKEKNKQASKQRNKHTNTQTHKQKQ